MEVRASRRPSPLARSPRTARAPAGTAGALRLERTRTSRPALTRSGTSWLPSAPVPPVTRTFITRVCYPPGEAGGSRGAALALRLVAVLLLDHHGDPPGVVGDDGLAGFVAQIRKLQDSLQEVHLSPSGGGGLIETRATLFRPGGEEGLHLLVPRVEGLVE